MRIVFRGLAILGMLWTLPVAAAELAAQSSAQVVTPVSLAEVNALEFGLIFSTSVAGTVTMAMAGQRSATGGAGLILPYSQPQSGIQVSGEPLAAFSLLSPSSITVTGNLVTLFVDTYTDVPADPVVLPEGFTPIHFGATLYVPANTPGGAYEGSIAITAIYE